MAKSEIIVSVGQDYTSVVELMKEFDRQIKESNHVAVRGGTHPISMLLRECYAAFLIKTFNPDLKE